MKVREFLLKYPNITHSCLQQIEHYLKPSAIKDKDIQNLLNNYKQYPPDVFIYTQGFVGCEFAVTDNNEVLIRMTKTILNEYELVVFIMVLANVLKIPLTKVSIDIDHKDGLKWGDFIRGRALSSKFPLIKIKKNYNNVFNECTIMKNYKGDN